MLVKLGCLLASRSSAIVAHLGVLSCRGGRRELWLLEGPLLAMSYGFYVSLTGTPGVFPVNESNQLLSPVARGRAGRDDETHGWS